MAATEIKAQLSHLRQLLHHSQADTLENRRHYNRLVQQYKALRGGAAVKAPIIRDLEDQIDSIDSEYGLNLTNARIYHTTKLDGNEANKEDPVVKVYGKYLRSDDTLCLLVLTTEGGHGLLTTEDRHDDYHWGLYNTAKETWHFPASSEKGVVLDPSPGAAEDPDDPGVKVHPPPAPADGALPEEVAVVQLNPPAEEEDL